MKVRYRMLFFIMLFPALAHAEPAPVLDMIMSRVSVTPPSYDGYVLGSQRGRYSNLECKSLPEYRKSYGKGAPVIWSPAETVCRPLYPTHRSYGDF